ncbi:MAG TPA: STAS domain-containing protein [Deltaproteobacteria bacterium]|nr:STAS domain-containing protein [Deltaproteobacteria bacterium]
MAQERKEDFAVSAEPRAIFLEGEVTSLVEPDLMNAYERSGGSAVALDLSRTESLDISGVNTLVKLVVRAQGDGVRLTARGLSPALREVFASTRIDEAIPSGPRSSDGQAALPGWAVPTQGLKVSPVPEGAINLNIDGRRPAGPIQGFGHLWEKTYRVALPGIGKTPAEVVRAMKENFPALQPERNRFFPSPAGIAPGEIVIINARTPAGLIVTGVWVLQADDLSFTFMAPEGHPESGWVSFTAFEDQGVVTAQIQGFARSSDPVYEAAFVLMGAREQETIWRHVLTSLARHFGVEGRVTVRKTCVACDYQWDRALNILKNAQMMTMVHTVRGMAGL